MEPLVTNRRVMTWLYMCPADESTSKKKRMLSVAFIFFMTTITLCSSILSVIFIVNYLSIDAVYQVSAEAAVSNVIIVAIFMRQRIKAIFTQLSEIYTVSKHQKFE